MKLLLLFGVFGLFVGIVLNDWLASVGIRNPLITLSASFVAGFVAGQVLIWLLRGNRGGQR
jgi:hypothetical protein